MAEFTIKELLDATQGVLFAPDLAPDTIIAGATIDTRTLRPGELYVPIKGDVFDGHIFISQAIEKGAPLVLSEEQTNAPHIRVRNCVLAYQNIAKLHRERFNIPVICITGSVGKTTTKDMVRTVLARHFRTHATVGNLNNQTGLPTTVLRLTPEHEVSVMELGTNHFGEIDAIARVAQPTICLFTNIGEAHIEFFGSREGIFRGKTEMLQHARPNTTVIVNGDDDLLRTVPGAIRYGLGSDNDFRAVNIITDGLEHVSFTAECPSCRIKIDLHAAGEHMIRNALASVAVAISLDMSPDEISSGLESFRPANGRADVFHTDRFTIIDGSYNANPTSMEAALKLLCQSETRKVCVFGDMLELGPDAPAYHKRIGDIALQLGIDRMICVGPLAKNASTHENSFWFPNKETLHAVLPSLLMDGDTILVKASFGMRLGETVAFIKSL